MSATTALGTKQCPNCKADIPTRFRKSMVKMCGDCRGARFLRMGPIRSEAAAAVHAAIKAGLMLPATEHRCTDCGNPASEYDHRDYTKPLCVDPVCRRCNQKRGHALVWSVDGFHPDKPRLIGAEGAPTPSKAEA